MFVITERLVGPESEGARLADFSLRKVGFGGLLPLLDKLEFVYTPKHGSWLNIAECEFSVLSRQCLDRRIADIETLRNEVSAWMEQRNRTSKPVEWRSNHR